MSVTLPVQLLAAHAAGQHRVSPILTTMIVLFLAVCRILVGAITTAFIGVATALCYYDLRVRKDGFGAPMAAPFADSSSTISPPLADRPNLDRPVPHPPIADGSVEDLPVS